MIVTDNFVYLHLPKTGGTFITEILKKVNELFPQLKVKELKKLKHKGIKSIPEFAKGLPIVTSIRPPHDHYISRYEFKWWRRADKKEYRPDLVRMRFPSFPNLCFSDFIRYRSDWDVIPLSRFKNKIRREQFRTVLKRNNIGFNSFELIDLICKDSYNIFCKINELTEKQIEEIKKNISFLFQPTLSEDLYNFLLKSGIPDDIALISLSSGKILPKFQGANLKKNNCSYYSKNDISYVFHIDRIIFRMFKKFNPQ